MASTDPGRFTFRYAVGPNVAGMDCGCGECPDCRPNIAEALVIINATGDGHTSFAAVLDLVRRAEDVTLRRLVELKAPPANRAQARRQTRANDRATKGKRP